MVNFGGGVGRRDERHPFYHGADSAFQARHAAPQQPFRDFHITHRVEHDGHGRSL